MHSAGLELTKLTYTRLEDKLIRHRGDRTIKNQVPGTSYLTGNTRHIRLVYTSCKNVSPAGRLQGASGEAPSLTSWGEAGVASLRPNQCTGRVQCTGI